MKSTVFSFPIAAAALVAATLSTGAAHATTPTLKGDVIDAAMFRDAGATRISGFGLDHPFVVTDGISDTKVYANTFALDVDGSSFTLAFLRTGQFMNGIELKLTGLDFSSGVLDSIAVKSNLAGYSFSTGAHEIDIDFSNVAFKAGSYLTGTFNVGSVSAVPEPSSFALAALGLAGVGFVAARSRASRK